MTSVCAGSFLLGAAGLLKGHKAASYWTARDLLPLFGAELVKECDVVDRNRITGGGACGSTLLDRAAFWRNVSDANCVIDFNHQSTQYAKSWVLFFGRQAEGAM